MIDKLFASIVVISIATSSNAEVCDYRPSEFIGTVGTTAVATGGTSLAAIGAAAKAAGFYILPNAVTGASMLGSTLGGASAAGTVGIMGGTAGIIGSTAAILLAPATIISAAVTVGGVLAYEGICYYAVDENVASTSGIETS
jgi:hypothetical protein